jgi:hypothetical protein
VSVKLPSTALAVAPLAEKLPEAESWTKTSIAGTATRVHATSLGELHAQIAATIAKQVK